MKATAQMTLLSMGELARTLFFQAQHEEAEAIVLHVIEQHKEQVGELDEYTLFAKWLLACILKEQGKVDESRQLALQVTALTLKARGDQHKEYTDRVSQLSGVWGVNPDWTEISEPDEADEADEADESGSDWRNTDQEDDSDPDGAEADKPEEPESNAASEQGDVEPDTALDEA
ncbi:MAG: hypothetical protein Q9172_001116 [Xanthocarpia lactea]